MARNAEDMRAVRQSVRRIAEGFCVSRSVVFVCMEAVFLATWDNVACLTNIQVYSYLNYSECGVYFT